MVNFNDLLLFFTIYSFLGWTMETVYASINLHGYICLQYSFLWGLLTFVLLKVVHPVISEAVFSIPASVKGHLSAFLLLYFLADTVKSVTDALDLRKVILNYPSVPVSRYYEKIIRYKRFFLAFPRLLVLNAGIINRDIRSILNERIDQIKVELKNRFLQ